MSREVDQEGRALDTVLATATAYLNVLRSEALLDIEREDLKRSDSSYERARSRLAFGAAIVVAVVMGLLIERLALRGPAAVVSAACASSAKALAAAIKEFAR